MVSCIRCQKEIDFEGEHIQICEFNGKNLMKTSYIHKICWEDYMNSKRKVNWAFDLIRGMKPKLQEAGLIEGEKVVIK